MESIDANKRNCEYCGSWALQIEKRRHEQTYKHKYKTKKNTY